MSKSYSRAQKTHTFSGTSFLAGARYAATYQREIAGFYTQEFGAYTYSKKFVQSCLRKTELFAPHAAHFIRGMSSKSLLTLEQQSLLLLHEEELYHRALLKKVPHCSAAGIAGDRGAVIGQTWDWSTSYFPWASLNWFCIKGKPKVLALSFPGLPICAGINSAGFSLMWTGAGYYPPLMPLKGVPTYALTFELLLNRTVPEAIDWLCGVPNSGAFIFFLADAQGRMAVVEGVPGKVFVSQEQAVHRANIFESAAACAAARQRLPKKKPSHSLKRNRTFRRVFPRLQKKAPVRAIREMLSTKTIQVETGAAHATLVQLVADCRRRELSVRWWREPGKKWTTFTI